ncbi:MAG: hypothetical protein MI810_06340 [Flavobacteriales bacterium]|nr:hypothetical protein [Flavobacteriales bacterium]
MMNFKRLIVLVFLLVPLGLQARTGILDKIISVEIKNTPIRLILQKIETVGQVRFSYNPQLVEEDKIVSLSMKSRTIRYGLSLIFDETIRFKEVGNHIVLLENESPELIRERKKLKLNYIFKGKITDKRSGKSISNASIYEVDSRHTSISSATGEYELLIPKTTQVKSLYFGKKGYHDTVIVVKATETESVQIDIALVPIEKDISKIDPSEIKPISNQPIEERIFSGIMISDETYHHSENLSELDETRWAQISLVPSVSIGSDLSTKGLITNHFSLNVLAGYSNGVYGVEVGGILNINKGNVWGAQVGGISNMVGGNVTGFQGAGIVNLVKGDFYGAQVGGIANLIQGNYRGVQVGGISSIVKRDFIGVQVGGITAISRGGFYGIQLGGISSVTFEKFIGFQIGGIHNIARDSFYGGQIAGISNHSGGTQNFLQIAGISNYSKGNMGLQLGGIVNYTQENKGLQIGLVNISRRGNGVALGLFNFVREGYHKTEIFTDELFHLNLAVKTGSQRFYNIYTAGMRFGLGQQNNMYTVGMGFGTYFNLSEKLMTSLDFTGKIAVENNFSSLNFASLYQFSPTLDFKAAKWITLFAGPSVNVNVMQFQDAEGNYSSDAVWNPIYTESFTGGSLQLWLGGKLGVRL